MPKKDPGCVCTMIGQIDRTLNRLADYGASSRLAKAIGNRGRIIRSYGRHHSLSKTWGTFVRYSHYNHGVVCLANFRHRFGEAWIRSDIAGSTQDSRIEDLGWVQDAIRQEIGLHLHLCPPGLKGRLKLERQDVAREGGTGQFSQEERAAIIALARRLGRDAGAIALEYGATVGLRPSEIVAITVGAYDHQTGVLAVPPIKWRHERVIGIPDSLRPGFDRLTAGRNLQDRLFDDVSPRSLQRLVQRARAELGLGDERSVMAFRGAYAQTIYEEAIDQGLNEADARREVARNLGHGHEIRPRIDVSRRHYLRREIE